MLTGAQIKNKAIIVSNFGTVQYIEKILDTRKM